jgi:hypothetical protein
MLDKIFNYHITWKEVVGLALAMVPVIFVFTRWSPEWWKIPGFLLFVLWIVIVVYALANICYKWWEKYPSKK